MGGTFDPIHTGHLIIAQEVGYQLKADKVLFMPAANPPHKNQQNVTAVEHRLEMVKLAIAGNPSFEIETLEIERGGLSYTADTLEGLRERLDNQTQLFFIIGADAISELLSWKQPEKVLQLAHLAVVGRPNYEFHFDRLQAGLPQVDLAERIVRVEVPLIEIAAHGIRERVQNNLPIKYLVPPVIEEYIRVQQLYTSS